MRNKFSKRRNIETVFAINGGKSFAKE